MGAVVLFEVSDGKDDKEDNNKDNDCVLAGHWVAAEAEGGGNGWLLYLIFGNVRYVMYLVGKDKSHITGCIHHIITVVV